MTPFEFTRSVRGLNRLRHIVQVLSRHGFGLVLARMNLGRFVPVWMLRRRGGPAEADVTATSIGRRLATAFAELGPTFVKLGQILSTRPDVVPAEVLQELRALQDRVPPFGEDEAKAVVEAELGKPIAQCFARWESTPFASASISQVHRATLSDGTGVVVKIRRPGVDDVIRLDMQLLRWGANSLENMMPETRTFRPVLLVSELQETLTRELDFVNEASVVHRFAEALGGDDGIRVPRVYWELSGSRVLTLEAIPGRNIDEGSAEGRSDTRDEGTGGTRDDGSEGDDRGVPERGTREAPRVEFDRKLVARRLADGFLKQVFELGFFHGDPHPGNILVEPPAKIGLVDFGQVGTLSDELMLDMVALLYACLNDEMAMAVDTLADMGALGRETDRRSLQRSLGVLVLKYHGLPMKRLVLRDLFNEFSGVMRRHDVVVPRDFALLIKAAGTIGGVIATLDPDLDLLELLKPRLRSATKEQFSPRRMGRRTALTTWDFFNIVRRAPQQIRDLLRRASFHGWELRIHHENLAGLMREMDRASNRLAFSVVIAAIIVGSSMVVSSTATVTLLGLKVQYLGIVGFLLAGLLGLGLSWAILRSGRLH